MLKVRPDILQKLKCSLCEGYLNITPIMSTTDKRQICGKCFKILPLQEKMKCVRQIGYESVAEMLLFPCRYNLQGCQSEFPLNEADNHELECPFRFDALKANGEHSEDAYEDPMLYKNDAYVNDRNVLAHQDNLVTYTTSPTTCFTVYDTSECISVESNYSFKENQVPTTLKYEIIICGNDNKGAALCLRSSTRNYSNISSYFKNNSLKLSIEGAISLPSFQNIFSKLTINPIQEPIYDTIGSSISYVQPASNYPKCAKCSGAVKCEIYHCFFGHDVCKNCKGNTCALCTSPINSVPRYYCKNFSKGCHIYLLYSEQYLHSKDCEFGEFKCLLLQCNEMSETLFALKHHLKDKHLTSIILSNLVVKQASDRDEFWITLAFDSLFKCKRFCYENEVEFLVELIGPHKLAANFKYEIYIKSDDNTSVKLTRSGNCFGWNASALDQAVIITKKELNAIKINNRNFTYTLNLIQVLKE